MSKRWQCQSYLEGNRGEWLKQFEIGYTPGEFVHFSKFEDCINLVELLLATKIEACLIEILDLPKFSTFTGRYKFSFGNKSHIVNVYWSNQ